MPDGTRQPHAEQRRRGLPTLPPVFDMRRVRAIVLARDEPGWLGGMRIRKKLLVLHTAFWLLLAGAVLLTLHWALLGVLREGEGLRALSILRQRSSDMHLALEQGGDAQLGSLLARVASLDTDEVRYTLGSAQDVWLDATQASEIRAAGSKGATIDHPTLGNAGAMHFPARNTASPETFVVLRARSEVLARQVWRLYALLAGSLLLVYVLVVVVLEMLILPQNVYRPIRRLLRADEAVLEGGGEHEQIPESQIPGDELGAIMRSRNETVRRLREQEGNTALLLQRMEDIAADLRKKNQLLEAAQRNLQDADRLASLGVLSAGIAHELNTPLAVAKGLSDKLAASASAGTHGVLPASEAALLARVIGRMERLSESLLDFARVRPPRVEPVSIAPLGDEAITLVRLDRDASGVTIRNEIDPALVVPSDADRLTQVLLNLVRNSVDAIVRHRTGSGEIVLSGTPVSRPDGPWASITIRDDGPGIAPDVLARIFEPFVSTTLDAKGTGLGLAVAEGIIREHGGVLAARNLARGAEFEILLPLARPDQPARE